MSDKAILRDFLLDLLTIDTVSGNEEPGIMYLKNLFRDIGIKNVTTQYVSKRSYNLVINNVKEPKLLIITHIDTVPIITNTKLVDDKVIMGTGAVDAKGSIAAIYHVLKSLNGLPSNVSIAIVSQEETTGSGSHKYIETHKPKFGLVMEPTNLEIANKHNGFLNLKIIVKGEHYHPDFYHLRDKMSTKDAFIQSQEVMNIIRRELESREIQYHVLKYCTENSDFFRPTKVEIGIEIIVPIGEKAWHTFKNLKKQVIEKGLNAEFYVTDIYESFIMNDNNYLEILKLAYKKSFGKKPTFIQFNAWTDAMHLSNVGTQTVIFGPGDPKLAHTEYESITVDDILKASIFLEYLISQFE